MNSIYASQMGDLANQIPAARVDAAARYESASVIADACWTTDLGFVIKPVTMGFHRSRRLRRPSP